MLKDTNMYTLFCFRNRLTRQIEKLKSDNDNLQKCISELESDRNQLNQQLNMSDIQLKKLENKILTSDEILADREENIECLKADLQNFQLHFKVSPFLNILHHKGNFTVS